MSIQAYQSYIVTKKKKYYEFSTILISIHFSKKKKIFAAARMRFIFVTQCSGNKALFFWSNDSSIFQPIEENLIYILVNEIHSKDP